MRLFVFSLATLIAASGGASAQSVLERVLGQIDGVSNLAQVNGTYANIAESVGTENVTTSSTQTNVPLDLANAPGQTLLWEFRIVGVGTPTTSFTVADIGTTWTDADISGLAATGYESITLNADGSVTLVDTNGDGVPGAVQLSNYSNGGLDEVVAASTATYSLAADAYTYDVFGDGTFIALMTAAAADSEWGLTDADLLLGDVVTTVTTPGLTTVIDGSITNIITGVTAATAEAIAGAATATEFTLPTVDLGDLSTTALGAVNTGEITLGVNSAVDESATAATRAISAAMTQIGGSADTGALVLNVAHNASAVNGSIQNIMIAVNGSIGSASTTALGAVNTGTITSGVNAAVQGIVGLSGQASSGL